MGEREAPWLPVLLFEALFLSYNDSIIVATKATTINAEVIASISIELFVPKQELLDALMLEPLPGFGLRSASGDIERVNRLIPIYQKAFIDGIAARRKTANSRDPFDN